MKWLRIFNSQPLLLIVVKMIITENITIDPKFLDNEKEIILTIFDRIQNVNGASFINLIQDVISALVISRLLNHLKKNNTLMMTNGINTNYLFLKTLLRNIMDVIRFLCNVKNRCIEGKNELETQGKRLNIKNFYELQQNFNIKLSIFCSENNINILKLIHNESVTYSEQLLYLFCCFLMLDDILKNKSLYLSEES